MVTALAGGVGGAKLVYGLAHALHDESLTVVVNTADDLVIHGLYVSPDVDTILYALAGLANPETGWGVIEDSFVVLDQLERLGRETWFRLGDRDLATHLMRTDLLSRGLTLTEATCEVARALGVGSTILPMSDERVATFVTTEDGEFPFQDYFVRLKQRGKVLKVRFQGAEVAVPTPQVLEAVGAARAIVLCPSNPIVSILPILSLQGLRERIKESPAKVVAVSPIVSGKAIRGPAAQMMEGLGLEVSAYGVASFYSDFLDLFVCDVRDAQEGGRIEALGVKVLLADTVMEEPHQKIALAKLILAGLGAL